MRRSKSSSFKQRAHALVDRLPHDADWSDLVDHAIARQDFDENPVEGEFSGIAEEVLEEYHRIQAEVERSRARDGVDGW